MNRSPSPLGTLYLTYARLLDFPTAAVQQAARDEQTVADLTELHVSAGYPAPPPFRMASRARPLEQTYIAAFEVGVPEPPVPLYETAYLRDDAEQRKHVLEEIVRFYEFFDLRLGDRPVEMPDHLVVELEFMAALAEMEQLAAAAGDPGAAYQLAQRDFLARHLHPLVVQVVKRHVPRGWYTGVLRGLEALTREHHARLAAAHGTGRSGPPPLAPVVPLIT